jgi:hypothetical protein
VLDRIHDDFKNTVSEHNIKIHSFQEAHGIFGMKGLHGKVYSFVFTIFRGSLPSLGMLILNKCWRLQVVDDFSSILDLPRVLETVESIDANHMQMARCRSRDDAHYRAILGILKQFIREEAPTKQTALADPVGSSCEWTKYSVEIIIAHFNL